MATLEERVSFLEAKMEEYGKAIADLRGLIIALDQKLDRRFMWLIGMQFTTLIAIIAGMLGVVTKLL